MSRLVHTAGSFMRSCGQCGGYVLVCGSLREPTMSRVETLPDEPAWHESKEQACGIRATNGKEGVSAVRFVPPCRRRQAWLLVRKESVRGDRPCTCGAHTKELAACDGRGKRGLQRDRRRLRGEGGRPSRERFARSGRARCALRAPMCDEGDGFRFYRLYRSVVDKKGLSKKFSSALALPATVGPDFSYCISSSSRVNLRRGER